MFSHTSIQKEIDWVPVLKVPVWCRSCIVNSTSSALWELWSWYLLNHICHKCLKKDHESWVSLPSLCGEEQNAELTRTQPILQMYYPSSQYPITGDEEGTPEHSIMQNSTLSATRVLQPLSTWVTWHPTVLKASVLPEETNIPGRLFTTLEGYFCFWFVFTAIPREELSLGVCVLAKFTKWGSDFQLSHLMYRSPRSTEMMQTSQIPSGIF